MTRDSLTDVPNQPRTPARSVRIPDDVWAAFKRLAESRGVTASDVVREALENYLLELRE